MISKRQHILYQVIERLSNGKIAYLTFKLNVFTCIFAEILDSDIE